MDLVVVAPGLLALPTPTLQSSAALRRIAAWAPHVPIAGGRDIALLATLPLGAASAATLIARGAGIDAQRGHWLVADPVTLVAGRDDVVVAARVDDADAGFVAQAVAMLDAHFAVDGLHVVAAHPDRWLLQLPDVPQSTFVATDEALGGSIHAHRPRGTDARRFERYANEMQMLLHDAPGNDTRERAGLQPLNGLWLWGGEPGVPAHRAAARIDAYAPDGSAGDLARGIALASGGTAHPLGARLDVTATAAVTTLVVLPLATPLNFTDLDAGWLAPAADALATDTLTRLTLLADGAGAHRWSGAPPSWPARLRARFAPARFGVTAGLSE